MSKKKSSEKSKAENQTTEMPHEQTAEQTTDTQEVPVQEKSVEEKLQDEIKTQKESYVRLAAEYDNYRKRTQAEKLSIYDDATAKAVSELLPVADSMDMAMQNAKDAPEEFLKGMELIKNQLNSCFAKLKVEAFGEVGEEFNPELHNAISKIDSDELNENAISQVFQRGYKLGDKIIRHAMVQVANCD